MVCGQLQPDRGIQTAVQEDKTISWGECHYGHGIKLDKNRWHCEDSIFEYYGFKDHTVL